MHWQSSLTSLLTLVVILLGVSCSDSSGDPGLDAGFDGGGGGAGGAPDPACNGSPHLCDRRFDEVSYPMAHNAMSNAEDGWRAPNQNFNITRQLDDGIRAMELDTYNEDGELLLCHVVCEFGKKPLVEGLGEVRAFLETNPNEVVSIIFESSIENSETASAIEESGLLGFTYPHVADEPWPTLRELIDADTRLVVFQEKPGDAEYPWLMYIWDHAWETHFSWAAPEDFNCDPNRGNQDNPLFMLNHFLTDIWGAPELAEMVNYNPLFIDRAMQCAQESDALPNFVKVDFYDIGDLFDVVESLNAP